MNLEKLKELRKQNKLSQEDMARSLNMTLRSYQNKESGKARFYIDEVKLIIEKLEIDINEIL